MSTPQLESLCTARPVEIRSAGQRTAKGYAAVFNSLSRDFGGWKETIHPTFFNKARSLIPVFVTWWPSTSTAAC